MKRDLFTGYTPREGDSVTVGRGSENSPVPAPSKQREPAATVPTCPLCGHHIPCKCALSAPSASRARALATCGTCGHGVPGRFGMIACDQERSKASVNSPSLPCPIERWVPLTTEQQVKCAAQAGIDQAVAAADRRAPGWSDKAVEWLAGFTALHAGRRYTGYELVRWSERSGFDQPENPKAWGGPIQRTARAGHLVKVGTVADPNPERHGSDVPLWECRA